MVRPCRRVALHLADRHPGRASSIVLVDGGCSARLRRDAGCGHRARRDGHRRHGVGLLRRDGMRRELGPLAVQLQRSIKAALDPVGIFNPGKVL